MNGYIGIPEKVNEIVGTQKIGMAEKVPWMVVYGLRAFHRNPGGKPDYRVATASFNRQFYDFGVPYSIKFCYLLKILTAIDAHLLKTTISTVHLRKGRSTFLIITINKTTFHHNK